MLRLYPVLRQLKSPISMRRYVCDYNSTNTKCFLARPRLDLCTRSLFSASRGRTVEQQFQLPHVNHMLRPSRVRDAYLVRISVRSFASSTNLANDDQQTAKIRSWAFELDNPFGKLISNTSFPMRVVPLNPIEFPSADRIFVHLLLRSPIAGDSLPDFINHTFRDSCSTDVDYNGDDEVLAIKGDFLDNECAEEFQKHSLNLGWYVEVPMSFDLQLQSTGQGHIYVEKFENKSCDFETEKGDCIMRSLKTSQATAVSQGGNISIVKSLLGNVSLTANNNGNIKTDKIQGHVVKLTSKEGTITCSDIYGKATTIESQEGDIITGNLHGECNIKTESGDVHIGSLDGSLYSEVTSGLLDVYAIRHKDIYINNTQGDVVVKVPTELKTHLHLNANEVILPETPQFSDCAQEQAGDITKVEGVIGDHSKDNKIHVKADNGRIKIKTLSWFDSLSFRKIMKEV
ncbi:protein FAM185A-like [Antedon mediterranea]|uniref:protein FAM185A-like n=1 Tax=Antedon mediterranea TaxID=105859 RepID=UPI003AF6C901